MRLHDAWHIRLEAEREAKIRSLEAEVARLRLTDAEVTFLKRERDLMDADDEGDRKALEIIDGLLGRLGGVR